MTMELAEAQPLDAHLLREYVLDMLDQLAAIAAEHEDLPTARALWSCWGRVSRMAAQQTDTTELWEGSTSGEVVPFWIDTPPRSRK